MFFIFLATDGIIITDSMRGRVMPETEITRIDPTTYQYLKSKLSSEIGSDVKASLFRQYWGWLAGFTAGVAVLGFVSVAKLIPDMVQATAQKFISNELSGPITAAKAQIKEFETLVGENRRRFETTFGETVIQSDALKQSMANMKRYSEDAEQDLRVLRSRIVDNKKSVEDLRAELITSIKKDLVTVPDFEAASLRISDAVSELLRLKADIAELQRRASITTAATPPASRCCRKSSKPAPPMCARIRWCAARPSLSSLRCIHATSSRVTPPG